MTDHAALMQRALQEIRALKAELAEAKRGRREPIAIIGMGCRFPGGADNPDQYWRLLESGTDAIVDVPRSRWDADAFFDPDPDAPGKMYTRWGGFLGDVSGFDAQFFGIPPLDAMNIDPQQRLLLEVAWEALENAGQVPGAVPRTGVYVGLFLDDYLQLNFAAADPRRIDAYNTLGLLRGLAAGRLAYVLDVHGPAVQLDTACSSSLLAAHLAVQALRNGECDLALAGGVNLTLVPEVTIGLCKLKALAADGRCKTFDARADGYVRGEGCGVVVLKRLSDALAAGDRIEAIIRGSAVNHDGRSNGLTAPNGSAQKMLIRDALADAGLEPRDVDFVEVHGTGTALGDPIEAIALGETLGPGRTDPLFVGSVKSNFGHLESAAGAAALIKVALSLRHGVIPPSLHFETPNPHIPWDRLPLRVPTAPTPWPRAERRVAGISSFGMSGTNVHMIVEGSAGISVTSAPGPYVLALSAPTPEGLEALTASYAAFLETSTLSPADVCHTALAGRRHFRYRRAVAGDSLAALAAALRRGDSVEWPAAAGKGSKVPLPTYLFQRQRYWVAARHEWPLTMDWLHDHMLGDTIVVPASAYLAFALEAGFPALRDVVFPHPLTFREGEPRTLPLEIEGESLRWDSFCTARSAGVPPASRRASPPGGTPVAEPTAGFTLGPSFRRIANAQVDETEASCRMTAGPLDAGLIDSALRTLALLLPPGNGEVFAPFCIDSVAIYPGPTTDLTCHARRTSISPSHITGDVQLVNAEGTVILDVQGLEARKVATLDNALYEVVWQTSPAGPPAAAPIVFDCTPTSQEEAVRSLLDLLRVTPDDAHICVVTRNTQPVLPTDPIDPTHAWVWGLARVVALERPRLRFTCVDLDSSSTELPDLDAAVRDGKVYVPRLVRTSIEPATAEAPLFRPEATYLVTGAFGALGSRVVSWMRSEGARHFLLVSRNAPVSVDVADAEAVAHLFQEARETMPPIRGIIHAAGALDDALLSDQTWEHFERAFATKVHGTRNLHEQSLGLDLDHFVCFSSAASLIGSRGQANYAAANAYMDALMHHRRRAGLPGLSINWSGWAEAGMAAGMDKRHGDRLQSLGFDPIDPAAALPLLGRLMRSGKAQVGVIPGDWSRFGAAPVAPAAFEPLLSVLDRTPAADRHARLARHLRETLIAVIGRDPFPPGEPEPSFFEMGMDSLMSLDLRNRLQTDLDRTLPSTVAFEYPTVSELADYLLRDVLAAV